MSRLVEHCEALGRVTGGQDSSARRRLEGEIGSELTRRLIGALARRGAAHRFLAL